VFNFRDIIYIMSKEILVRKNSTIIINLNDLNALGGNKNELYFSIFIPFEPDELIIRNTLYARIVGDESNLPIAFVYLNIVNENDQPICYFSSNFYQSDPMSHFTLKKPFPNSMIIKVLDVDGDAVNNRTGLLCLQCEFVKYK